MTTADTAPSSPATPPSPVAESWEKRLHDRLSVVLLRVEEVGSRVEQAAERVIEQVTSAVEAAAPVAATVARDVASVAGGTVGKIAQVVEEAAGCVLATKGSCACPKCAPTT